MASCNLVLLLLVVFVVGLLQVLALEPVGQRKLGSTSTFSRGPGLGFNGQRNGAFGPSNNRASAHLGFNRGNGKVGGGLGAPGRPVSYLGNGRVTTGGSFNRNSGAFKPGVGGYQAVRPFPGVPVRNAVFNGPRPVAGAFPSNFRQYPGVVRKF